MNKLLTLNVPILATAAAALLVACGRPDDATVGQKVDSTIARAEEKAADVRADAQSAAGNMADKAREAAGTMADKVADAAITASVNAELAKDSSLSALKIDVDTVNGRVALSGTAPDAASRDRATRLAQSVRGVVSVDNRLAVGG